MELKDLEQQYKKIQKQLYYKKRQEALKANPEAYEEFKRKDRERQRARYLAKKKQNTEQVKKPTTAEELKAEIRRLKCKEVSKRYYAKLKADPERYAKMLELNKERLRKYRAKKKAEREEFLAAANKAVEFYNATAEEETKPINLSDSIIGIANNVNDKNIVVGEGKVGTVSEEGNIENVPLYSSKEMEVKEEDVNKAYDNLINTIRAYVPNFIHTSEIHRALDRYINAYSMFLDSNKKVLLSEIIKLFNK